jgi:hypothetical protein
MAGLIEFYCRSNETSLGSLFKWLEYTFKDSIRCLWDHIGLACNRVAVGLATWWLWDLQFGCRSFSGWLLRIFIAFFLELSDLKLAGQGSSLSMETFKKCNMLVLGLQNCGVTVCSAFIGGNFCSIVCLCNRLACDSYLEDIPGSRITNGAFVGLA